MSSLVYAPPPTIERFMMDGSLVRLVVGPVGSGKSMGAIMELFRRATQQAPATGTNVRYTRFAVIRNTLSQLRQTVLSDVQQYLQPMISYFVTDSTIRIRAPLADGTVVHSDWLMIPLDTKEDQRRLLSTQLTGAWINEIREVPIEIVSALLGRLGRYPSKLQGGPTWFGLIADCNPFDTDSPYYEKFVLNPMPNWTLFHQPSGIGPNAENVNNLPPNYYENLMSGRDDDWSAVHVESQWGTSNAGQAVFRRSFHVPTHVRDIVATVNPMRPIALGVDFGRTPCALIAQVDTFGRLIIFEEITTDDMGLHQMLAEHVKPRLLSEPYIGKRVFVVADPAGAQRSQHTEETAFDILKEHGVLAYPASTNNIEPRINAVERLLRTTIMGEPALQISRTGCPTLVHALGNKYRYRRKRDGQIEDNPEKLHPWSDVCFVAGTPIATPDGERAIETLRVGDVVLTHLGPRRVALAGSRPVPATVSINLSNGITLRCTPDHPFAHAGIWARADSLREGDILEGVKWHEDNQETTGRSSKVTDTTGTERINITGVKSHATNTTGRDILGLFRQVWNCTTKTVTRSTTILTTWNWLHRNATLRCNGMNMALVLDAPIGQTREGATSARVGPFPCMLRSGQPIMARSQPGCRSIIRMRTQPTTPSTTLKLSLSAITAALTLWLGALQEPSKTPHLPPMPLQPSGTAAKRVRSGTEGTPKSCGLALNLASSSARYVGRAMRALLICGSGATARHTVKPRLACSLGSTTKTGSATGVVTRSAATAISANAPAPRVVGVSWQHEPVCVFNLEVEDAHTYYAGGALVHNCDALQYLCLGVAANLTGRVMRRDAPRPVRVPVSAGGWT